MLKKEFPYYPDSLKQNMTLLLLRDFLSHWWPIPFLILMIFFSLQVEEVNWTPLFFSFIFGPVIVSWQRSRGAISVYATLPLSRKKLSFLIWLQGVLVFPLFFLVFAIISTFLTSFFGEPPISLTEMLKSFSPAIIIGIGHASFMLILLPHVQQSTNNQSAIRDSLVGGLWGMLIPAPLLLSLLLFPITNLSQYLLLVLFFISMILFFWSYLVRDRLISLVIVPGKRPPKTAPRYCRTPVFFWLQFWSRQMGILFLLLLCCSGFSMLLSMTKRQEFIPTFHLFSFLFFLGFLVPCLSATWVTEIRPFRALPMTAGKLSIFLLSMPFINIVCATSFILVMFHVTGMRDDMEYVLVAACFALGLSSILYNALILFGQMGVALCCLLLYPSYLYLQRDLFIMVPIIGLVICPFFIYQIKNNSEVYRHRSSLLQGGYISGKQ